MDHWNPFWFINNSGVLCPVQAPEVRCANGHRVQTGRICEWGRAYVTVPTVVACDRHAVWRTKNGAMSHQLPNEGTCIREYSTIRPSYNGNLNDLQEMCRIGLMVEYSRMQVPSLGIWCDIAPFLARYMHCDVSIRDQSSS